MSSISREDYAFLDDNQFEALKQLRVVLGTSLSPQLEQMSRSELTTVINKYVDDVRVRESKAYTLGKMTVPPPAPQPSSTSSSKGVKVNVSSFKGKEGENLPRWKNEVESAIIAGRISEDEIQVAFALSFLAGRAKDWAFGKRMVDKNCFPSLEKLFDELEVTFQPPKSEFRTRTQFLSLKQGSRDLHSYAQEARFLIGSLTRQPIDMATQVATFLAGLKEGPVRTQLYRVECDTLETAISLALHEDFSQKEAKRGGSYKPHMPKAEDKMDVSNAMVKDPARKQNRGRGSNGKKFDLKTAICRRCQKKGHLSYDCRAPAPVPPPEKPAYNGPGSSGKQGN